MGRYHYPLPETAAVLDISRLYYTCIPPVHLYLTVSLCVVSRVSLYIDLYLAILQQRPAVFRCISLVSSCIRSFYLTVFSDDLAVSRCISPSPCPTTSKTGHMTKNTLQGRELL